MKPVDREIGYFAIGVKNEALTSEPRFASTIVLHAKIDSTDRCTVRIVCAIDRVEQIKQLSLPHFKWETASKNG